MGMNILIEIFCSHLKKIVEAEDTMCQETTRVDWISQRTIDEWNILSTYCVNVTA